MRTRFFIGLLGVLCVLMAVGPAVAQDSFITYPDDSRSEVYHLGNGAHAFVFYDYAFDDDIFIHPVDFFGDLLSVSLSGFTGFALWLDFEGTTSQGFLQYGVYTCTGSSFSCSFGNRRGTLLL